MHLYVFSSNTLSHHITSRHITAHTISQTIFYHITLSRTITSSIIVSGIIRTLSCQDKNKDNQRNERRQVPVIAPKHAKSRHTCNTLATPCYPRYHCLARTRKAARCPWPPSRDHTWHSAAQSGRGSTIRVDHSLVRKRERVERATAIEVK